LRAVAERLWHTPLLLRVLRQITFEFSEFDVHEDSPGEAIVPDLLMSRDHLRRFASAGFVREGASM
jgi:hypothetical protein